MSNFKRFANNYNWSGLEYPVAINKINEFEKKNGIPVNVLGVKGEIYIYAKRQNLPTERA